MSLIHTCELNQVNPFDYLTELQKHATQSSSDPDTWLPWNYRDTLGKHPLPPNPSRSNFKFFRLAENTRSIH